MLSAKNPAVFHRIKALLAAYGASLLPLPVEERPRQPACRGAAGWWGVKQDSWVSFVDFGPALRSTRSMQPWHRYVGILLDDFYSDGPVQVVLEKDLSLKQKFLDIVLLLAAEIPWVGRNCPVGLEPKDMRPHNLLSFKSHQDTFNGDAGEHLVSCLSDYRYQEQANARAVMDPEAAKSAPTLLPNGQVRVMAVTARYPGALARKLGDRWRETNDPGVYRMEWGTRVIDVIVCRRVEVIERNSLWLIFSGDPKKVAFGIRHLGLKQSDLSTILNDIHDVYQLEGLNMPYTVEDYRKEVHDRQLKQFKELPTEEKLKFLSAEERLADLSAEERLANLSVEERLANLSAEERLANLSAEERLASLSVEERLANLSAEERLANLSTEERLANLSTEERLANLSAEERLADLSVEQIEAALECKRERRH